jgi:hypothetical protein
MENQNQNNDDESVSTEATRTNPENENETIQRLQQRIRRLEERFGSEEIEIDNIGWSDVSKVFLQGFGLDYVFDAFFQTKLVPQEDMSEDGRFIISKDTLISIVTCVFYLLLFFFTYFWKPFAKKQIQQDLHRDYHFHGY